LKYVKKMCKFCILIPNTYDSVEIKIASYWNVSYLSRRES
jgi:hypothetical protein